MLYRAKAVLAVWAEKSLQNSPVTSEMPRPQTEDVMNSCRPAILLIELLLGYLFQWLTGSHRSFAGCGYERVLRRMNGVHSFLVAEVPP